MTRERSPRSSSRAGCGSRRRPSTGRSLVFDDRDVEPERQPGRDASWPRSRRARAMDVIVDRAQEAPGRRALPRSTSVGEQRDEYPQVFTEIDRHARGRGARPLRGGDPPLHRAVGDQVLPGQRDGLGRGHGRPPPLPDPFDAARRPYEAEGEVIATGPYAGPTSWRRKSPLVGSDLSGMLRGRRTSDAKRARPETSPMPTAVPADAAARLPKARMIDPRGHRFGAATRRSS